MSIDLRKKAEENLISLSKTATISLSKKGLGNQKARVALALDISGSMTGLFSNGIVQAVCERTLGLGMNFDDNGAADVFLFGMQDYSVGEIQKENFYEFVSREIRSKYRLENGTHYAGVMRRIAEHYYPGSLSVKKGLFGLGRDKVSVSAAEPDEPVYVIFVTDGNCFDGDKTAELVRQTSKLGIFWQFVGVGRETFQFLKQLDDLDGRLIDNANFFQVNDLKKISDEELYDRLLGEFPDWLKLAKEHSLIK
ncbi:VWA domain-containing protein [Saccharibacillus sp. CPCC 101409]|uniref:VWA domain-containing protein n=1 Tax=Saccharibacillus sp. CPCC 101409 TaxID=3058041 RepID=UPI002673D04B|nr:VWA domain-containing protein [Saccharibacillus sp. CPCC 101409]MDO3408516.1 VWA domain-containing protein [Saccharibacillus sp. CPCC 101409]